MEVGTAPSHPRLSATVLRDAHHTEPPGHQSSDSQNPTYPWKKRDYDQLEPKIHFVSLNFIAEDDFKD